MKIILVIATLIIVFGFSMCLFAIQNSGEPYFLTLGIPYTIAVFIIAVIWDKFLSTNLET